MPKTKHGYWGTPTYCSWHKMKQRCQNPHDHHYDRYGGRGIGVCRAWETFPAFLRDMGERPENATLDRIDNDKGYCKKNCRWATRTQQQNNVSNNRVIHFREQAQTLSQWAHELGMNVKTLENRLNRGWSVAEALTAKVDRTIQRRK